MDNKILNNNLNDKLFDYNIYLKILDLSSNYDFKQLRENYLHFALLNHPDKGGNIETFKNVSNAYQILNKIKTENNNVNNIVNNSVNNNVNNKIIFKDPYVLLKEIYNINNPFNCNILFKTKTCTTPTF